MSAAASSALTAANSASLATNGMRGGADPLVLGALLAYVLVFMLAGALIGARKPDIGALEGGVIGGMISFALAIAGGGALVIAEALLP